MHHRRSIRLCGYDYAQAGAYFVTICARDKACLFGDVVEGEMRLGDAGRIVDNTWNDLPHHYVQVDLDAFVIMPNHIHGIIVINNVGAGFKPARPGTPAQSGAQPESESGAGFKPATEWAGFKPAPTMTKRHGLPEIVRAFKTFSARKINALRNTPGTPVWQRNYYEHIARNESELDRIRQYIADNPANWDRDREDEPWQESGSAGEM